MKVYRLHNFNPQTGHEDPKPYRCSSTLCLTTTLDDNVDGQHHAPAALASVNRTCTLCKGGWLGLGVKLDGSGKFRSPTGIRSLDCPGLRGSLYRLRHSIPLKSIWNTAVWFEAAYIHLKLVLIHKTSVPVLTNFKVHDATCKKMVVLSCNYFNYIMKLAACNSCDGWPYPNIDAPLQDLFTHLLLYSWSKARINFIRVLLSGCGML